MNIIFYIISILGAFSICIIMLFLIINRKHIFTDTLPKNINKKQLGILEGSIQDLKYVIVAADVIEKPTDTLLRAVEYNFNRGVKYIFLISQSKFKTEEQRGFSNWFRTLADRSQYQDLFNIKSLLHEWNDYPYIFYRLRKDDTGNYYTFGYRGEEVGEGIAESYVMMEPSLAHTVAQTLLSNIGLSDVLNREEFESPTQVINIVNHVRKKKI